MDVAARGDMTMHNCDQTDSCWSEPRPANAFACSEPMGLFDKSLESNNVLILMHYCCVLSFVNHPACKYGHRSLTEDGVAMAEYSYC